ncbi:hypothetical protein NCAS_0C01940 [Naumovozyma castellii]|uniref:Translocation protein SEC62 n=1 Tax=Naumovozyma castellii TaxID=27288 RepID=G0VCH4_NAUCA|nr:hypothetical protein NCAS_0C01940 [Naumovozyma castellii CBS 4309]CCC69184.1 hypothetical protein NCAS_0C01940 [Naumovozyma castellii CBS 4309]
MSDANPDTALAIAKLLRHHRELKQRKGLFQTRHVDFFRFKRFERALKSPEYIKKSTNQPDLYPPVTGTEDEHASARNLFIMLIKAQYVVPCQKLHNQDCKNHGLKANKDYPNLILSSKATLQPDEYYVWNYNPKSITDYLIVIGVVSVILALACYPLWPRSMRRGSYYVSMGCLMLLCGFFVVAIIRLILYVLSLLVIKKKGGFWLFPNLFEDCGVLDSFKPLYGFGEKDSYSYIKKMKRMKRKQTKNGGTGKPKIEEVQDEGK